MSEPRPSFSVVCSSAKTRAFRLWSSVGDEGIAPAGSRTMCPSVFAVASSPNRPAGAATANVARVPTLSSDASGATVGPSGPPSHAAMTSASAAKRGRRPRRPLVTRVLLADDLGSFALQLEDMHAGVRAVDDVDVAAVVGRDVVGLDDLPRDVLLALELADALVGGLRDLRDEVRGLLRVVGVAHVDRAEARVEVRDEHDLLVERRTHLLVRRVRTEPPAAIDEVGLAAPAARGEDLERRDRLRATLRRDVHERRDVTRLVAEVLRRLGDHDDDVALRGLLIARVDDAGGDRHLAEREARVAAVV